MHGRDGRDDACALDRLRAVGRVVDEGGNGSAPRLAAKRAQNSSMSFLTGNLARPWHTVKTEPDVVLDATLAWQNPFEHVFVKLGSDNRRSIEAVCAWIALDVGLPTPAPRFVHVKRAHLPNGCPWRFHDANEITAFATVAIEGARQLIRMDADVLAPRFLKWNFLEMAAVFDHLIANDDRSDGNMLTDARGTFWLIDHGRSLGGGGQRFFSTDVLPSIRNFLLEKIGRLTLADRMKRRSALMSACVELAARVPRVPYERLLVPPAIATRINSFLLQRASRLQAMVLDVVGLPDMYQGENESRVPQ
jgi:hypothetical protein